MTTTRVNFRLPTELVERTDLAAAVTHTNRTAVVTEALVAHLDALEDRERYKESLVERYLDEAVGFEALREAVGRRDAEAIRASRELLDDGDELIGALIDSGEDAE